MEQTAKIEEISKVVSMNREWKHEWKNRQPLAESASIINKAIGE